MVYNVVIIGSGPAGLTAGMYAARAKLQPLVIEGPLPGGQLMTTSKVENWPGELSIMGPDLMINMREQTERCGATLLADNVVRVDFTKRPFHIWTAGGKEIEAQTVIIATGAVHRKLGCKGEAEYMGKGVSNCATCDAPFYEGKDVVIVGGGNSGVTEAEHLTHVVKKITLVHVLDKLTATDPIKDKILAHPKVSFMYNSTVVEIGGNGQKVTHVVVENKKDKTCSTVPVDGVFVAIGLMPNTDLFKGQIDFGQYGYLNVVNHTRTNIEGVFAAGDVADYRYKQAITSSAVGAMAALDVQMYLAGLK
jgi:thioredoxin reductase (NADPH)